MRPTITAIPNAGVWAARIITCNADVSLAITASLKLGTRVERITRDARCRTADRARRALRASAVRARLFAA